MANTCRAADLSMPKELRELMLQYVRDHTQHGDPRDKEAWLDDDWFCFLGLAGSKPPCDGSKNGNAGECCYDGHAGKKPDHTPRIALLKRTK